jgi:leader peptidase (prepilin peptidase)/N-methyltransferase
MLNTELEMVANSTGLQVLIAVYVCAVMGSFLNVVLFRGPLILKRARANREHDANKGEKPYLDKFTLSYPPSHCPTCGKGIKGYQNVPIVSWLVLRGRSACCGLPISPRYVLVELGSALYGALVVFLIGFNWVVLVVSYVLVAVAGVWLELRTVRKPSEPERDMWMALRGTRSANENPETRETEISHDAS